MADRRCPGDYLAPGSAAWQQYHTAWRQWPSGLAAVSYGLASMAMVFLNKGVLTYYKFSMTLLALQMIATTALIYGCGKLEWIAMRPFSLSTARRLLPLSFFYNANVAFALASLQGVNIPMYIALKRLTPMAVLITGFFTGKSKPPLQVTLSVSLTTFGCLIAALGDFSLDPYAYALALTSVLCQTFYLLLVERSGAEQGISSFELMFYNALLSLPFLGAILLCTNELPTSVPLLFTMLMFYNALLSLPFLGAILLCTYELPTSIPRLFTMVQQRHSPSLLHQGGLVFLSSNQVTSCLSGDNLIAADAFGPQLHHVPLQYSQLPPLPSPFCRELLPRWT
ncbi:unnamed protein product [Closterium sp. Naga37s-1]|nr:unnamed protein product [Closterium sp. Naga37s-1]